jgi:alginate O-acetyltransferase complex protein AlgI
MPGWLPAWSGSVAFALQIYFDFSGYTDIAIGTALLFGFHFPINFRRPYFAASVTDFWHRWHMSLSRWLRDYVYIPLGGNRRHTYRNLMLTMLLGGLWHGASWNFVVWGGYHGVLLAVERATRVRLTVLTFPLVCTGWVLFRAATLGQTVAVWRQMFSTDTGAVLWNGWQVRLAIAAVVLGMAEEYGQAFTKIAEAPAWVRAAAAVVMLLAIELLTASEIPIPFVYFEF